MKGIWTIGKYLSLYSINILIFVYNNKQIFIVEGNLMKKQAVVISVIQFVFKHCLGTRGFVN